MPLGDGAAAVAGGVGGLGHGVLEPALCGVGGRWGGGLGAGEERRSEEGGHAEGRRGRAAGQRAAGSAASFCAVSSWSHPERVSQLVSSLRPAAVPHPLAPT